LAIADLRLPIGLFGKLQIGNRHLAIGNLDFRPANPLNPRPKIVDNNRRFRLVYQPKIRLMLVL
jgi:hypothetical protein